MIFSYNWLQDYIREKLPKPAKLAELLTLHSFEVKSAKKAGRDFAFDIDVLPNRGQDCFSHIGVAREISANTGFHLKALQSKPLPKKKKNLADNLIKIELRNKNDCQRYSALIVNSVRAVSSPKWLQERLKVCGLRPINNIVDITNYVMLETGQPLHAFDLDKIQGSPTKKIIIRRAQRGEKITTLDSKTHLLDDNILVIADQEGPLAIAGIKGGKKAEIDKKTELIVLESANFNSFTVRAGSKKLGLKTDSSLRFEHKIDANLTEIALKRAAYLIEKLSGGKVFRDIADFYPKKILPKRIKFSQDLPEKLLGVKMSWLEIKNTFKKLGFRVVQKGKFSSIIEIPTWRRDIELQEDLIEEAGRLKGYDKIPAVFPLVSLAPAQRNEEIFWADKAKNVLKGAGFFEVYNYSFVNEKALEIFGYGKEDVIEVENPTSQEQRYLRPSLIPNLLKTLKENSVRFADKNEIQIFELGRIFTKNAKSNIREKTMLTGLFFQKTGKDVFFSAKGFVDFLLESLGISSVWYDEYRASPEESKILVWKKGASAEIKVGGKEIGFLGELESSVLGRAKIEKSGVALFDINFEELTRLCSEEHGYLPFSIFPEALRDIAVLAPKQVRVEEVLNKIETAGGNLLRDVELFDIYEGQEIDFGKKNLAFHLIFQAKDRTLSPKEIDELQEKIARALEENPDWEVRK